MTKQAQEKQLPSVQEIKERIMKVIKEFEESRYKNHHTNNLFNRVNEGFSFRTIEEQQILLSSWNEFFLSGYVAPGYDLGNNDLPFFHLTKLGKEALANWSADPANPDGYLTFFQGEYELDQYTMEYARESLLAFNRQCNLSAVMMIGIASERILYLLRDTIVNKQASSGNSVNKDLQDHSIKRVIDSIEKEIITRKRDIPQSLYERFDAHFSSLAHHLRYSRNDVGHPSDPRAIESDEAHVALLTFRFVVTLVFDLIKWIDKSY